MSRKELIKLIRDTPDMDCFPRRPEAPKDEDLYTDVFIEIARPRLTKGQEITLDLIIKLLPSDILLNKVIIESNNSELLIKQQTKQAKKNADKIIKAYVRQMSVYDDRMSGLDEQIADVLDFTLLVQDKLPSIHSDIHAFRWNGSSDCRVRSLKNFAYILHHVFGVIDWARRIDFDIADHYINEDILQLMSDIIR
jgi:hypothetical protein